MTHVRVGFAVLVASSLLAPAARALPTIPPEFLQETRATGLEQPVNFDFLPDGRVLMVERVTGRIRLMREAGADADTVGTIPDLRTSAIDEGLLGIAVDPRWPLKPFIYLHLTAASTFNVKVVRYALTGDLDGTGNGRLALDPSSRREILPDLPDDNSLHNGGTLVFGPDDMLYVALGDDGVPCSAQDIHQLRGKILRLSVEAIQDGGGPAPSYFLLDPADNPYSKDPDPRARLVWQYGLRNPWSFDFDFASKQVAIADVGEHDWEEVDVTAFAGRNFGWPFFEGTAPYLFDCDHPDFSNLTPPSYAYGRDSTNAGLTIILGGVCYHPPLLPSGFPQEYWGQVFFLDFYSGRLSRLTCENGRCDVAAPVPGQPDAFAWGSGFTFVPRMRFGPDNQLWYLQGTELRRIHHPGTIGIPPAAGGALALRAFPVPSPGDVRLSFRLAKAGAASMIVADTRGRRVRTLLAPAVREPGEHVVIWDGTDDAGARAPAGVYFAALRTDAGDVTRRLIRL